VAEAEKIFADSRSSYKAARYINRIPRKAKPCVCMQSKHQLLVIADSFSRDTAFPSQIRRASIRSWVLKKVPIVKSLKRQLIICPNGSAYESVLILDADNVLHPDFYQAIVSTSCWIPSNSGERLPANQKHRGGDLDWACLKKAKSGKCSAKERINLAFQQINRFSNGFWVRSVCLNLFLSLNAIEDLTRKLGCFLLRNLVQYAPELASILKS